VFGSKQRQKEVSRLPLVLENSSDLEALVKVLRRLSVAHSIDEIVHVVTQAARALLGADGTTFVLRDGDLCYYLEEDAISPLWKGKRFPMSACISGWCMLERQSAAIPDIYQDARIPQDAYRPTFVKSLAMVPVGQENPTAAIGAYWAASRMITARELELLQTIANAAALAIGYVQLQERQKLLVAAAAQTAASEDGVGEIASLKGARPGLLERAVRLAHTQLPQNSLASYGFAMLCVLIASAVRFGAGAVVEGEIPPFGTYYPAILIATLIGGVPAGLLALALSGAAAWWFFVPAQFGFSFSDGSTAVSLGIFVIANLIVIAMAEGYRRAYRRLKDGQARAQLLLRELQHRSRNSLAVVQAVISHSLKSEPAAARKISDRIRALSMADELVDQAERGTVSVAEILKAELKPYGMERVLLEGGYLLVDAVHAKALALTFHELATNAAKYGALSHSKGVVAISWTSSEGLATIRWEERGGPCVVAPAQKGFGTSFVDRVVKSIGGNVEREFHKEGLCCRVSFPTD
jgi:two-component sensor histidine kinase